MWRTLSGIPIPNLSEAVVGLLSGTEQVVHVGTDSQHYGYHTNYVTVVVIILPGQGGRIFYEKSRVPKVPSLAHKLFREAELSLITARALDKVIAHDIIVHVDANEDLRHRSSKYVRALSGMVVGHGFQVRVKPNSWCATHVADYLVKGKHHRAA